MSGSITIGQKTLASHDNNTDKLSLHNDVQFPAGHIIQTRSITCLLYTSDAADEP